MGFQTVSWVKYFLSCSPGAAPGRVPFFDQLNLRIACCVWAAERKKAGRKVIARAVSTRVCPLSSCRKFIAAPYARAGPNPMQIQSGLARFLSSVSLGFGQGRRSVNVASPQTAELAKGVAGKAVTHWMCCLAQSQISSALSQECSSLVGSKCDEGIESECD
jgi:hypothetical protein